MTVTGAWAGPSRRPSGRTARPHGAAARGRPSDVTGAGRPRGTTPWSDSDAVR